MTDQELREIEERAKAATEGPWKIYADFNILSEKDRLVAGCGGHSNNLEGEKVHHENCANAEFVKHSISDIPKLLSYIRELRRRKDPRVGRALKAQKTKPIKKG
jgi:hypothetical protein